MQGAFRKRLLVVAAVAGMACSATGSVQGSATAPLPRLPSALPEVPLYDPSSAWYTPLAAGVSLHPNSPAMVNPIKKDFDNMGFVLAVKRYRCRSTSPVRRRRSDA